MKTPSCRNHPRAKARYSLEYKRGRWSIGRAVGRSAAKVAAGDLRGSGRKTLDFSRGLTG